VSMHKVLLAVGFVSLMGFVVALSPNHARAATECNGTVTGAISGGLVVHPGDNCDVENAIVSGGIQMDGGTLTVCNSRVTGGLNVTVSGANSASAWVNLGNLELGCAGNNFSGGVHISGVQGQIPGDELAASVELEHNTISGGLTLDNNALVEVESNTVSGGCTAIGPTTNFINFLGPNVYTGGNNGCPA
jgi:hypothetical protein